MKYQMFIIVEAWLTGYASDQNVVGDATAGGYPVHHTAWTLDILLRGSLKCETD